MITPTICLNMIVKNESKIIERLLRSVLPVIDTYCICDTGSTDNTVELITAFMEKAGKPGCVIHEPFRNFGYNRTFALEKAKDWGKYALLLDADMILDVNESFKKEDITADGYTLMQYKYSGGLEYKNLRLIRTDIGVKCVGPTHEIYGNYPPGTSIQHLISLRINDQNDGGCKATKYERDIQLLEEALVTEPDNSRYMFYLANSFRDCGKSEQAVECYIKNLSLQGWSEEKYMSCLSIYEHLKLKDCEREGLSYLVEAHKYSPTRIEHIYRLVTYYSNQKMYSVALAYYNLIADHYTKNYKLQNIYDDILFRNISEYTFYLPYMMIIVGGNLGNHDLVYKMYRIIFHHKNTNIGDWFTGNLFFNLRCLSAFTPDMDVLQDMLTYRQLLRSRGFVFDSLNEIIQQHLQKYSTLSHDHSFINILSKSTDTIICYKDNCKKLIDIPDSQIYDFSEVVEKNVDGFIDRFTSSSPCIISAGNNRYLMNIRYVNYTINRQTGAYTVQNSANFCTSINKAVWLDADLQVTASHWFDHVNNTQSSWHGVEDVRIVKNDDNISFTGVVYKCNPNERVSIGYGIYDMSNNALDGCTAYTSPMGRDCEKNWASIPNTDLFVYSWNPLTIIDTAGKTVQADTSVPGFFTLLRGSSNGCRVGNELWFLCHVVHHSAPRQYYHVVVVLDGNTYSVKRYTNLFKICGDPIEYALGMIVEDSRILFSFSRWDSKSMVLSVPRSALFS